MTQSRSRAEQLRVQVLFRMGADLMDMLGAYRNPTHPCSVTGRQVTSYECASIVSGITKQADLDRCRACPRGQSIAQTARTRHLSPLSPPGHLNPLPSPTSATHCQPADATQRPEPSTTVPSAVGGSGLKICPRIDPECIGHSEVAGMVGKSIGGPKGEARMASVSRRMGSVCNPDGAKAVRRREYNRQRYARTVLKKRLAATLCAALRGHAGSQISLGLIRLLHLDRTGQDLSVKALGEVLTSHGLDVAGKCGRLSLVCNDAAMEFAGLKGRAA